MTFNMPTYGKLTDYDDSEDWIQYTERLESYFDANAHLGYRINDQWSIYGKANNIANQDYNKWVDYPVQGLQIIAGTTYKFDF